jgi:aquaporin Z
MDDRDLAKAAVAEFLGAFTLVMAGVGAIISTQNLGDGGNLVAVALAHGLAIALMAGALGAISGGHFNPAVTVAMLATGNVKLTRAGVYVVAQLLGGIAGAGILTLIFPALGELGRNNIGVNLGVPGLGPGVTPFGGVLIEAVMTFFLVLVIFGTAVDPRGPKALAPLLIGLTITMDIVFGGRITGAAMNPARAFGPEVVQQDFTSFWIYWVGPIVGGLVAAFLYTFLFLQPAAPATPASRPAASAPPQPQPVPPPQPQRRRNRR